MQLTICALAQNKDFYGKNFRDRFGDHELVYGRD